MVDTMRNMKDQDNIDAIQEQIDRLKELDPNDPARTAIFIFITEDGVTSMFSPLDPVSTASALHELSERTLKAVDKTDVN